MSGVNRAELERLLAEMNKLCEGQNSIMVLHVVRVMATTIYNTTLPYGPEPLAYVVGVMQALTRTFEMGAILNAPLGPPFIVVDEDDGEQPGVEADDEPDKAPEAQRGKFLH